MTSRLFDPRPQLCDANGDPMSGCKLYTYAAGTSTPLDTYSDSALTVPNANPIVFGSDGRPPSDVFYGPNNYRLVLQTAAGVTVWTADPVDGASTDLLNSLMEVSGTANAIILTSPFVASTYQAGQALRFTVASTNTGAVTVNWNGLGVRSILNIDGGAITAGMLRAGQLVEIIYDGSAFRLNASSGWQFISEQSGAQSAYVFELPAWPTKFRMDVVAVAPVAAPADLMIQVSTDNGATWKTTAGDYVGVALLVLSADTTISSHAAATGARIAFACNNAAGVSGAVEFDNSVGSRGVFQCNFVNNTPEWAYTTGGLASNGFTATHARLLFNGTTISSGRARLRGIA